MRTVITTLGAALALALAAPAAAAPVTVDPAQAPSGPDPKVAWYDRDARQVHVGDRTIAFAKPGVVTGLRTAAGGVVLERSVSGNDILTLLRPSGETRRLAQGVLSWHVATGDGAGRRLAVFRGTPNGPRLDVVRVADGGLVARRKADGLFDFHNGTVWLETRRGELATWNVGTGRMVAKGLSNVWALDAARGTVAYRKAGCTWNAPLRKDAAWKPWCSPEAGVFGWSPDGRRVLTYTISGDDEGVTRTVVARNARTGKLLRSFTGFFGDASPAPRWETDRAVLVTASSGQPNGEAAVMRLRTDGTVRRASELGGDWPWETRAVYASPR